MRGLDRNPLVILRDLEGLNRHSPVFKIESPIHILWLEPVALARKTLVLMIRKTSTQTTSSRMNVDSEF
jgi:hypothetical protein